MNESEDKYIENLLQSSEEEESDQETVQNQEGRAHKKMTSALSVDFLSTTEVREVG